MKQSILFTVERNALGIEIRNQFIQVVILHVSDHHKSLKQNEFKQIEVTK